MSQLSKPSIQAHFLEKGIQQIMQVQGLSQDLSSIFMALEKFQREIQDCKNRDEVLLLLQQYVHGLNMFHESAFYLVNAESGFDLKFCSHHEIEDTVNHFLMNEIRAGRFAWALQQNRAVVVDSVEGVPGPQVVLHSMSTHSLTLGMFVGFVKKHDPLACSSMLSLVSIMISSAVFVLENQKLQAELIEHNRKLEVTVEARTQELRCANETLHRSNGELKRLNEKKSEFLGIAVHDLKNPLTAIFGCVSLVLESLQAKNDLDEIKPYEDEIAMLNRVDEAARHMIQILEDLLGAEALESGQMTLKPVKLDLSVIARKVVIINQAQAEAKSIKIHVAAEEVLFVRADALRIHEAIDNLVSNAIKYSNMASHVWVRVEKRQDAAKQSWIQLSVCDEGPGLSEQDKQKAFGRFQKLSARPTAGESSTGLGLSIVKQLIEMHYGKIWVDSELGKGSCFCFRLPSLDQ